MAGWNDVYTHLGYLSIPDSETRPYPTGTVLDSICTRLTNIDSQLQDAADLSMALEIDRDLKVNFAQQVYLYKLEGSQKLRLLSHLTGIPIFYDKYYARSSSDGPITPVVVKSLW